MLKYNWETYKKKQQNKNKKKTIQKDHLKEFVLKRKKRKKENENEKRKQENNKEQIMHKHRTFSPGPDRE